MTTVAVLGTGRMGAAMARALARTGADLVLWNRTPDRAARLAAETGGQAVATVGAAAERADIAITMLADDAAVVAVYGGDEGIVARARAGAVLVDCSTVRPDTLQAFDTAARGRRVGLLDAPVSGSTSLAEAGQLTLMVGGEPADLERARPALDPLAKTIFHLGPLGSGAAMKLAVNTAVFGLNNAVAEALVLAEAAGVSRERAYEVLAASVVGAPFLGYKREAFLAPETTPVAFALELAEKDLRLITALADDLGVPMPQAAANLALIREASATAGPSRDFSAVATHLRAVQREGTPT